MPNLLFEKCKNCGAPLNASRALNGVLECEYCGSAFTLPKEETASGAIEQLKIAANELDLCRFDDAFASYRKAAELDENEPEAYFGMALSEFRVQYLKDNLKHRLQPVCHAVTDKKFSENKNYLRALSLATKEQAEEYGRRAAEIDYIASEFFRLKEQGTGYDCFICVKVTDDDTGMRTADYKYADDVYFSLRGKGYRPFFSERELKNVTGADYEARILYALCSSECMLVVCGKEEYLNTPWVKNEYSRFLALIRDEEKASDSITLAFFGKPIEKLHGKNGRIQGIDLGAMDATERVTAFVEAHTPEAKKRREAEEKAKRAAEAELKKRLEEQQRAQREIEEQLKNLRKNAAASSAPVSAGVNITSLLVRAKQELDFGDYGAAAKYYGQAIDADPENGEAWFGAFLCEQKVKSEEELLKDITLEKIKAICAHKNYLFAVKNAAGDSDSKILAFKAELERKEQAIFEEQAEQERILREEQAERERKAREEAENRERLAWLCENDPSVDNYNSEEFEIQNQSLVKYIGSKRDVKVPRGVTSIQAKAFKNCKSLISITIPNSVISIGNESFSGCSNLECVVISNGITKIGDFAFSNCYELKEITIPPSLLSIGTWAFSFCTKKLTRVNIADLAAWCKISFVSNKSNPLLFAHNLYLNGELITDLVIPNTVESIGKRTFINCDSLTSLTIPMSVTNIEKSAFGDCCGLKSVTMPLRFQNMITKIFKDYKKIKFTYTE